METTKVQLGEAEKKVILAKSAEAKASQGLTVKKAALDSAEKSGEAAKKTLASAEDKLSVATKKLQEANAKAAKQAQEAKQKAAESKFTFFILLNARHVHHPTHIHNHSFTNSIQRPRRRNKRQKRQPKN